MREAELFVMAEHDAGRGDRPDPRRAVGHRAAPLLDRPGADRPAAMRVGVDHYALDDAWVPDLLAGRTMDEVGRDRFDGDLLGGRPAAAVARFVDAACAAAGRGAGR